MLKKLSSHRILYGSMILSFVVIGILSFQTVYFTDELSDYSSIAAAYPSGTYSNATNFKAKASKDNKNLIVTGSYCSNAGENTSVVLNRQDGATLTTQYTCMSCTDLTPELPGHLRWIKTSSKEIRPGTMCGESTNIFEKVETLTWWTDPYGQCNNINTSVKTTIKKEIPEVIIMCPINGNAPSPTNEKSPTGLTSASLMALRGSGSPSRHVLSCLILESKLEQIWKDGHVWNGREVPPWGIPPGGSNFYQGSKIITQTLDESRSCPSPYRKLGKDTCETSGDAKMLGLSCSKK